MLQCHSRKQQNICSLTNQTVAKVNTATTEMPVDVETKITNFILKK